MLISNLAKDTKAIAALGYFAAGQTTRTSSVIDMANFDGAMFVLHLGTVTDASVITLTVKGNTADSVSSPTPVSLTGGTNVLTASTSSNTLMILDIYRPQYRYLFVTVGIATQNCEIVGINAHLYGARVQPVTQHATVAVAPTLITGV